MNSAIFITARLKSTRLPKKAVKLIEGREMIRHLIDRLRLANSPDQIVVCTSTVRQDDPLEAIADEEGIGCFRGDPEDVLIRLTNAACEFDINTVISCTADNPLTDPTYIDRLLAFHRNGGYDYSKVEGLPFGTFSYAIDRSAMKKACRIKAKRDTEVWGGYFTKTGLFDIGILQVKDKSVRFPSLRLTVDTPADFKLITAIFEHLYDGNSVFSLEEVTNLLSEKPDLRKINSGVSQKSPEPIKIEPEE